MRVGFVLCGDLSNRTGGFLYDRMLIHGMRQRGVEVDVIQLPWRSYLRSLIQSSLSTNIEGLDTEKVDVIIEDELAHPLLIRANRAVHLRSGKPVVSLVHHLRSSEDHPLWMKRFYRYVERRYLNTLDGVIANSPATLAAVRSTTGRELPALVAPPGRDHFNGQISAAQVAAKVDQDGPLEILFLGSIIPRKRLHDLIEALALLPDVDLRLTVIGRQTGSRAYVRATKQLIRSRSLQDRVRWRGELPDEQVSRQLIASHLLIVPSSHEGFGIAYLDAMGYGVVPIGTTSGGSSSIIDHAENGLLIEPGDITSLSEHIRCLASDRERLHDLALHAFQRYQQHPTWEEVTIKVIDFLRDTFVKPGDSLSNGSPGFPKTPKE